MKVFKITPRRILSYFSWIIVVSLILVGVFYYAIRNFSFLNDSLFLIVLCISVLLLMIPMLILFVNHYNYFRKTKFEFDEVQDAIYFSNKQQSLKFFKKDITEINEYNNNAARSTWNNIYIWEIRTKEQMFKLTNIIISKPAFDKIFEGIKMERKIKFFPTV